MEPLDAAGAASPDLLLARVQMGFTLAVHIAIAVLGVGFPVLILVAEGLGMRRGDAVYTTLARRWSKAFAVLFAVGAVSGTVLSFELGLLWPEFMGTFGPAVGFAFTLEGFAFFLEAIFVGIHLYGWDRLSPRAHWWSGVPIAVSGAASAVFVVTANAFMNTPAGVRMEDGRLVDVDPLAAMWNPAAPAQTTHMLVAAYMVTGFVVASVYAVAMLRGRRDLYHRRGLALGLALGASMAPVQAAVGDWAARVVARTQPVKLAAMEAQFATERGAPLRIGGWPDEERATTRWALEIPGGLSWLAHGDADAEVLGLLEVPPEDRPPVLPVHLSFQFMVAAGVALLGLSVWAGAAAWRRRAVPQGRVFLLAVAAAGPVATLAMEAGWMVTEIGRQPWVVTNLLRTSDAVTPVEGLGWTLGAAVAIYAVLGAGLVVVLRHLARKPLPAEARVP